MYGDYEVMQVLSVTDMVIMAMMVGVIFIVPVVAWLVSRKSKVTVTTAYMSGINHDDGRKFVDSFGEEKDTYLANWYLLDMFGPTKFMKPATIIAAAGLIVGMVLSIGGVL